MCGVAGVWSPAGWSDAHRGTLQAMCDAIAHRGPDQDGFWVDAAAGLGLGHRRLSIIDLSPAGSQPMRSRDGRWAIAFNGEVYNFRDLRKELEGLGARFNGHSDTEVLVEAIARWGVQASVGRAAGMFAFAAWDSRERTLYLCRDRFGEKPLHYAWIGDQFYFGSELKALVATGRIDRTAIDRAAVAHFLKCSCIPAPMTIHAGVHKLPPATIATVRADRSVAIAPYWSITEAAVQGRTSPNHQRSRAECADLLEAQLRRSVSDQMVSDVPLGALLSGGVDSSVVVALMAKESTRKVQTFSIGFHEPGYDEASHARAVAAHLGTDHTELYVSPEEARQVIPVLAATYDEPFSDSSQIPTILVSRLAHRQVTVALSGDGGDEVFGGYDRYFRARVVWNALSRVPSPLRRAAASAIRAVPVAAWNSVGRMANAVRPRRQAAASLGERAIKLAAVAGSQSRAQHYERFRSHWLDEQPLVLGHSDPLSWRSEIGRHEGAGFDFVEEMMLTDAVSYLPDDVLVKVDRAAMSTSLETRAPLLDHRVAELAWSFAFDARVDDWNGKAVLKEVLFRHVPRALVDRPKMGFGVPIDSWLRGPLRAWGEDLLSEARLRRQGLLRVEPVRTAWEAHVSGRRDLQFPLWDVLMLQAWLG